MGPSEPPKGRMGLAAVFQRLVSSEEGRKAVDHLHEAAHARTKGIRRAELRMAIRAARRALLRR